MHVPNTITLKVMKTTGTQSMVRLFLAVDGTARGVLCRSALRVPAATWRCGAGV
jgi:hypothetical protein